MRNSHTPRTQNTEGIVAKISTLTTALGEQLPAHTVKKKAPCKHDAKRTREAGVPEIDEAKRATLSDAAESTGDRFKQLFDGDISRRY